MRSEVVLRPVDGVDITILVDNSIDILVPDTQVAHRPPLHWDWSDHEQLRAEHGFSAVVTIHGDGATDTFLYDAGLGRDTAGHNMDVLGIDPTTFRAMVLSHGHIDHHGGLEGLYRRLGRHRLPLILHPDAWLDRRVRFPTGTEIHMPPPSRQDLNREGWEVTEERNPSYLLDETILVTGQVERVTAFETGMPIQWAYRDGEWEADPFIWEDQAVVLNLRDRGLVVLSGCSHAGIINILRHARRLTGIDTVYAVVGGMHLTGGLFEQIIPQTVAELEAIAPAYLVPGHCTGWKAIHQMAASFPGAYIQSNVGTQLRFRGAERRGSF